MSANTCWTEDRFEMRDLLEEQYGCTFEIIQLGSMNRGDLCIDDDEELLMALDDFNHEDSTAPRRAMAGLTSPDEGCLYWMPAGTIVYRMINHTVCPCAI